MLKLLVNKIFYGFLVTLGVVIVVFFLFTVLPGDPARMMLGQRADLVSVEIINRELGKDQPIFKQFLKYANDLSPLCILDTKNPDSRIYFDKEKYGRGVELIQFSSRALIMKAPYLGRSYQSRESVSAILLDALPGTAILAIASVRKKVVVNDQDEIEVRSRMNITGSFDHRVADGAVGAKFVNAVKTYLENPTRLLQ